MMMTRVLKRVKLKGKINPVIREQYLRDDVVCQSSMCKSCYPQTGVDGCKEVSKLGTEVSHYAVLSYDVVAKYFEIFELPELRGTIILQSVALKVLQSLGRNRFKSLLATAKDARRGSILFLNEICKETSIERLPSQSEEEWLASSVWKVANYYDNHLESLIPVLIVVEDEKLFEGFEYNNNLRLMNVKTYLETMWPNLQAGLDLYESICAALVLSVVQDSSKEYESHLPLDVLEAGIKSGRFIRGTIHVNKHISSQEAYVTSSRSDSKSTEDILIHGTKDRNRAIHGDDVAIELFPRSQWKSKSQSLVNGNGNDQETLNGSKGGSSVMPTGKVVGVLDRRWRDYVASFPEESAKDSNSSSKGSCERVLVLPYDYRIPKIRIATKQAQPLRNQRIVVRIDGWGKDSQYPNGHFVRTLGEIGLLETEIQSLLVEYGISVSPFPLNLLPELPSCTETDPWSVDDEEVKNRKDLRSSHLIFSIDPKGCEDVDDALSVRHLDDSGSIELGVHIADVTYFVKPSSLTDLEARSKSTSVYLPDRRYDMLPHVLSGNVCSLLGNVDRYAVSVLWTLDSNYDVKDVWYGRTVIRSQYKLCYEDAQSIILDHSPEEMKEKILELSSLDQETLNEKFSVLKDSVMTLLQISRALRAKRLESGGLELDAVNMKFEIDRSLPSVVQDFKQVEELEIHKTVAECMIFTNHWVAKQITKVFPQQSVLRHHPPPREHNLVELQKLAASIGYDIRISTNRELASSLGNAVDPTNPMVNQIFRIIATRAMNEATYMCSGFYKIEEFHHYGLGIEYYTHFTSPIRRYADVMVHRLLLASVTKGINSDELMKMADVESICQHMNEKHRAARDVEKSAQELFLSFYFSSMSQTQDSEECLTDAVVYSTKSNGLLVYLPRYGIKGAVCLCDKDKKVAVVEDDGVSWRDGHLEMKDTELTVKTADSYQKYSLFDVITVCIKVQKPKAHQPKLVFDVIKRGPHLLDVNTVRKLSTKEEAAPAEANDLCVVDTSSRPTSTEPYSRSESRSEDRVQCLYDMLQCMRKLTLQCPADNIVAKDT